MLLRQVSRAACRAGSLAARSAAGADQSSRLADTAAGWAQRFSSSAHTELEELNQELAGYFGGVAADLDSTGGAGGAAPAAAETPRPGGVGAASSPDAAAQQAAAVNQEMLEFFGAEYAAQAAGGLASASSTSAQLQQEQQANGRGSPGGSVAGDTAPRLTHVDASGRAAMVDVSDKPDTVRSATAGARVLLGPEVFALVAGNQVNKGDVLTVAQLAGVTGAKYTSHLIPLCHNILLSKVGVHLRLAPEAHAVDIVATARTVGPTGVEMEALTAASVAALTVYDMVKAASKGVVITDVRLLAKSGGRSGDYRRGGGWAPGAGGEA